jgi:hypothetical protein
VEEIVRLRFENGQFLSKCQQLEEDATQHKELAKDLNAENDDIHVRVRKIKDELWNCMKGYKTQLACLKDELNQAESSKEELNMNLSKENKEAYQLCKILQQEIDMLCKDLDELQGKGESSSNMSRRRRERENMLADQKTIRVSWADENHPRQ